MKEKMLKFINIDKENPKKRQKDERKEELKYIKIMFNQIKLIKNSILSQYKHAYGFIANQKLNARHNASIQLQCMPCW